MTTRPKEVARFELLFLAAILIGLAAAAADWRALAGDAVSLIAVALSLGLTLALVLATSRLGSNIARWVLTILTLINIPLSLMITDFSSPMAVVTVLANLLQLVALVLIFSRPAREWIAARRDAAVQSDKEETPAS